MLHYTVVHGGTWRWSRNCLGRGAASEYQPVSSSVVLSSQAHVLTTPRNPNLDAIIQAALCYCSNLVVVIPVEA